MSETARQPAGQPTGGQFAPTSGSDAGIDLAPGPTREQVLDQMMRDSRTFQALSSGDQDKAAQWNADLIAADDRGYVDQASQAIYDSTMFGGDLHNVKVDLAANASRYRGVSEGHSEHCAYGYTLYNRAWNNMIRSAGEPGKVTPSPTCDCGAGS